MKNEFKKYQSIGKNFYFHYNAFRKGAKPPFKTPYPPSTTVFRKYFFIFFLFSKNCGMQRTFTKTYDTRQYNVI
jgi:hypothetical protein